MSEGDDQHHIRQTANGPLTDEIIEAQQCASELAVAFHDHPNARTDTSVNQF